VVKLIPEDIAEDAEYESCDDMPIESDEQSENEDDEGSESGGLHAGSFTYPGRDSQKLHEGGNPETFFQKLDERLAAVGIDYKQLDSKTDMTSPPPCFVRNRTSYTEWLRFASTGKVPLRMDMPGEPNYCHDCTPEFKIQSMRDGSCLFPNTRFEHRKELDERTTCGVSRSPDVPPESYVIYQEMTVPLDALRGILKRYASEHVMHLPVAKFKLEDMPPVQRLGFTRINWGKGEIAE
jgi:hypothetical protein